VAAGGHAWEQLWYLDAVLFPSSCGLIYESVYQMLVINRLHQRKNARIVLKADGTLDLSTEDYEYYWGKWKKS
jgi:hypothetical protein